MFHNETLWRRETRNNMILFKLKLIVKSINSRKNEEFRHMRQYIIILIIKQCMNSLYFNKCYMNINN